MEYLYNGVKLPDINSVWTDKTTYPYALLTSTNSSDSPSYGLYVFSGSAVKEEDCIVLAPKVFVYVRVGSDDKWIAAGGRPDGMNLYYTAFWANVNIYNSDGSLYLAASNPVPVGGFTIDQTSFLAGYKAGAELRRLRVSGGGGSKVIIWDGSTDGKVVCGPDSYGFYYAKISDYTQDLIGATLDDGENIQTITEADRAFVSADGIATVYISGMLFVITESNYVFEGITFTEAGLYAADRLIECIITLP